MIELLYDNTYYSNHLDFSTNNKINMAQFAKRTEARSGGITVKNWVDANIMPLSATQGKGILFDNMFIQKGENRRNFGGNAPIIMGSPFKYTQAMDYFSFWFDNTNRDNGTCFVPTGIAGPDCDNMFSQCGAQWISAGILDSTAYNEQYVALMYTCAIQSVIWTLVNEEKKDAIAKWIGMAIDLCNAAKAYFKYKPLVFSIIEPLREAEDAIDMLSRAIAFIFFDDNWTIEELLRILEVSLKRWVHNSNKIDFVTNPILGIIGIVLVVPTLRDLVRGKKSTETVAKILNENFMYLMKILANNIIKKGIELNKLFLFELCQLGDLATITRINTDKLYDFCVNINNANILAPLAEWKLIALTSLPFDIILTGKADGKPIITKSKFRQITDDNNAFKLSSTAPSEWAPVQLLTTGIYHFKGKQVGDSTLGIGNTQGKTNTCLVRFTTGDDVIPHKPAPIQGMSSAGMLYREKFGRWDYENINKTLNALEDFKLTIMENGSFSVEQNDKLWYEFKRNEFNTPVMVGFKFLEFTVTFKSFAVLPEEDLNSLTGLALMKRLATMKLSSH